MLDSREWALGDCIQRGWVDILVGRGWTALPTHELQDNAPGTKAPMLMTPGDLLVAPDVLVWREGTMLWHEVKAKAKPGWKRVPAPGRWEHGIDYANWLHYGQVQERTGLRVVFVVHEVASPRDPAQESELLPSGLYLGAWLNTIARVGEHRPTWPGGMYSPNRRGRNGLGGWLWPRACMSVLG